MPVIKAQPGPQELFLATSADIAIYGGSAGGGKTYALLLENVRHINNGDFGSVIFRRNAGQIMNEGGLWDNATEIYPLIGAKPKLTPRPCMIFPSGAKTSFAHLQYDGDVHSWQGSQIPLICFDELTHFTRKQFFYMLSRNRSACGIKPYIRATCNPDAESWVADFISWWIDENTGYAIPERSGKLRYFIRVDDTLQWADSREELVRQFGCSPDDAKSVTFIASSVFDNKILLEKDPGYVANLKALSRVEKERLLFGNWKIKPAAGLYFKRQEVSLIDVLPSDITAWVRAWDLAASEVSESNPDPDYTAGVLMGRRSNGRIVVADVVNVRYGAHRVRQLVKNAADQDGRNTRIALSQDPGQAGKEQSQSYAAMLAGYTVEVERESGDKVTRAEPFASQWQAGNVEVLRAPWNNDYFAQLEGFPDLKHDDMIDSSSRAFSVLVNSCIDYGGMTISMATGDSRWR